MTGPPPAKSAPGGERFRPDLEGLRGLAILLVLLFHAGIPGIVGGFIGVDVFFVLSGFLITGLLIRERERTGRVSLPTFYARRARRILPAALVVIVATLLVANVVLAPLDLLNAADDAVAVALSVGNIQFAITATDYFASGAPSPYLHYWSLGVEEQFYLLWPALLILATAVIAPRRPRLGAGIVLGAVVAVSLVFAVWLTDVAAPWAFYSLPSRAWQLGLGGLLAIAADRAVRRHWTVVGMTVLGWVGLIAVLAAALVIDAGIPYPGVAAIVPAVGAAAVIAAGSATAGAWSVGRLLALAPMRFLGRISYSLYLVHWPILVLPAYGLSVDEQLPLQERIGLALLSVVVGAICWRIVEEPIHRAAQFRTAPWRSLGVASAAIAMTLVAVLAVSASTSAALDSSLTAAPVASPAPTDVAAAPTDAPAPSQGSVGSAQPTSGTLPISVPPPSTIAVVPSGLFEASPSASDAPTDSPGPSTSSFRPSAAPATAPASAPARTSPPTSAPTAAPSNQPDPSADPDPKLVYAPVWVGPVPDVSQRQPLPANVKPPLRSAASDREQIANDGCELGNFGVTPPRCTYGDPSSSTIVALVGDSHAAQWFPALEVLAKRHHWRLEVFTKISCRFVDLPIYSRDLKREYTECEQWRELVVVALQKLRPDVVVVSAARGMATVNPADDSPARQGAAMARLLARVPGKHAIIVDTPQSHVDVPSCLSQHVDDTRACDTPRPVAVSWRYLLLEQTAARADHATLINMTDVLCQGANCPAVLGGYIVLRDVFHLTATFSAALADALEPPLVRLAGG